VLVERVLDAERADRAALVDLGDGEPARRCLSRPKYPSAGGSLGKSGMTVNPTKAQASPASNGSVVWRIGFVFMPESRADERDVLRRRHAAHD
jgi:hypothetical protein